MNIVTVTLTCSGSYHKRSHRAARQATACAGSRRRPAPSPRPPAPPPPPGTLACNAQNTTAHFILQTDKLHPMLSPSRDLGTRVNVALHNRMSVTATSTQIKSHRSMRTDCPLCSCKTSGQLLEPFHWGYMGLRLHRARAQSMLVPRKHASAATGCQRDTENVRSHPGSGSGIVGFGNG